MTYRGYTASFEYDADDNIFVGRVLHIEDIIGFHADSHSELERKFRSTIDLYLEEVTRSDTLPGPSGIKS